MNTPNDNDLVPCPRCKGTKISPDLGTSCGCCDGTGKITEKLRKVKAQIAKDIAARLMRI